MVDSIVEFLVVSEMSNLEVMSLALLITALARVLCWICVATWEG